MTISDDELYKLAETVNRHEDDLSLYTMIPTKRYEAAKELVGAILQRFKPREPRVSEGWGVVDKHKNFYVMGFKNEDEAKQWFAEGRKDSPESYLAKAVITEIMERVE